MTGAPETVRGEIAAGTAARALTLAYREAKKQHLRKRWDSLVIVLEPAELADEPAEEVR